MTHFLDTIASKFEMHYFLKNNSHSMNAIIRNRCEYELLNIFNEVANRLEISIEIESEALDQGGIKEVWNFLGKNASQITIIILVLTIIVSRFPVTNPRLDELKETELNLSIEEKKLNIEKLKNEIKDSDCKNVDLNELFEIIDDYLKIRKHKSNFYHQLMSYSSVSKISAKGLNENYEVVFPEKTVERKDFYKFILQTDNLSPEIDDQATIEIISPVLKSGNYKWKGLYENEAISFYMKDSDFRASVIKDGVKFKNGTIIECVVEKKRKIDNLGEIIISGYSVKTVVRKYDDTESFETPQGKKYKRIQKEKKRQYDLFKTDD